ncbi:MAG TPA: hypothetical protein VMT15_18340 [Bryobacteraceae bacterium]|nr:hypothetical protein [Bryobacteraceae bacterium]
MSFLDNLENNLKALERIEEKDPEKIRRDQEQREADRNAAIRRAPHVEALKKSAFTSNLLTACRTVGYGQRVLVQFVWIGETLRLTAKDRRLDLIPEPDGITAVFSMGGEETGRAAVKPETDSAEALAKRWLTGA